MDSTRAAQQPLPPFQHHFALTAELRAGGVQPVHCRASCKAHAHGGGSGGGIAADGTRQAAQREGRHCCGLINFCGRVWGSARARGAREPLGWRNRELGGTREQLSSKLRHSTTGIEMQRAVRSDRQLAAMLGGVAGGSLLLQRQ